MRIIRRTKSEEFSLKKTLKAQSFLNRINDNAWCLTGQHNPGKEEKGVKDPWKASNLREEEEGLLILCKVLRRKEADEEISFILAGHIRDTQV